MGFDEKTRNKIALVLLLSGVLFVGALGGICEFVVQPQGYPCQEHTELSVDEDELLELEIEKVTTQDGYILSLQRIPQGKSGNSPNTIPVLLQHGLLMDAGSWMISSPSESLPFILADNGFDVWMANTRGTNYSRSHTSLDPNDPSYWNWSWDELVAYDLPANVDYIHDQTDTTLHYAGHSLGTLMALASFSKDSELVSKIRSAAMLSPIAYMGNVSSNLARDTADAFVGEVLRWLGIKEFDPLGRAAAKLLEDICDLPNNDCSNLISSFTGPNCCMNASKVDDFLEHEPQPTSTRNMVHLAQMIRQGNIAMYDYGSSSENSENYGQPTPPVYNMANIPNELPLFMSNGGQDFLSDVNDVNTLINTLKAHDPTKLVVHFIDNYAHADFIFGENAKEVLYNPMIAFFQSN